MTIVPGPLGPAVSAELMPRRYNFAADVLERNLRAGRAHKAAYVDPRGSWSFGQLADRAARFGQALRDLGVRREERVLLCLFDTIDWPTAFLGAVKAGNIPIPVNTLMTEEDYRFILADSGARTLIVSEAIYAKFENLIKADDANLRLVIVSGEDARGHHGFEDLIVQAAPAAYTAPTTKDDICFWLYTSGSTGRPKGAVHVHADLKLTNDLFGAHILALTEEDVCYSAAKLFFAYGLGNALTFPLSAGATTILLPERPTADAVAALLRQHPVTVFYGVPTFYAGFLASAAAPRRDELKLRLCISAGEALPAPIGRRWQERYGVDILDGLGSTEMTHTFLSNRPGEVKYGTTGKPVPGYDLRLVDDAGAPVRKGEIGELQVRGPTSALMYWNNRQLSRATFLGEWTRSGDKYREDPEGFFVYCGRRDDMLKVGGMYVSPFEVEGVLCTHPDVLEAAVVAWPDPEGLIKPKAFVVLRSPDLAGDALARGLQSHCKSRLAPYKYPRVIEFRAELPKTATGKIQRFKLRAEHAAATSSPT